MHHSLYCSFHHARLSYRWLRSYEDSIDDSIKERGPITTSDATEVDAYVQPFSQPMEKRTPRSQMKHLELQLLIVFTGKTFIKMAVNSLKPKITTCLGKKKLVLKGDAHHSEI